MVAGVQTPDEAALAPVVASSYRMVLVKQEREKLVLNKEIDQLRAEAAALKARVAALEKENAALRPTPAAAAPAPKTPAKSTSKLGSFVATTPPAPAAGARLRVALTADLGQTDDSLATMTHIKAAVDGGEADLVLFPGDLSYADGYGPRWDSYGRLSEFLFASVPAAYAPGNHEFGNGEGFAHYLARYAPPDGPPAARAAGGLWHAFDAGPAHFVLLCAYCDTSPGSLQYRWLSADLAAAAANRATSPWIVAAWHAPMYNSNTAHQREPSALRFQANFEPLFLEYGVDLCFAGHVHSYERTTPVAAGAPAKCAPVHVGIGDGGNREGPAAAWLNESETPAWSAFREASFGHGLLDIRNATSARWTWYRNDDGDKQAGDDVWIERCAGGGVNYAP